MFQLQKLLNHIALSSDYANYTINLISNQNFVIGLHLLWFQN